MLLPADDLTVRTTCRSCGGLLDPLLDLGEPVLSSFVQPGEPDPASAPLAAVICQTCDLVQLSASVHPRLLYGEQYWYHSGINETMVEELKSVVAEVCWRVPLSKVSTVIDIGANDGTLLHQYEVLRGDQLPCRFAIEPATSLVQGLAPHANMVIHGYFPDDGTFGLPKQSIAAITTIACFYDIEDPRAAVREVDRLLQPNGVWIVQFQDLLQQVQATAWDNFCFEHRTYYSLTTFMSLLEDTDLQVIDLQVRAINGGSLRLVIGRRGTAVAPAVTAWRLKELAQLTRRRLQVFAWESQAHRDQLADAISYYHAQGHAIDLYACSTKANTLLQWAGLNRTFLQRGVERSPFKVGLETGGTRIPIISEEAWRADPAPITVLGAWQFRDAILKRESQYLADGGTFLVPLPNVEVCRGVR